MGTSASPEGCPHLPAISRPEREQLGDIGDGLDLRDGHASPEAVYGLPAGDEFFPLLGGRRGGIHLMVSSIAISC
jgi:hypothetical protein